MRIGRLLFVINCFWFFSSVALMNVSCAESEDRPMGRVVGGPCHYKSYPGAAAVVSVEKVNASNEGAKENVEAYDVQFVFHSRNVPEEMYERVRGKRHRFLLTNGSRPKSGFLKKYGISEGKTLPCDLEVIVKGTCTPILFKFPTVDLTDDEANR